jgi:hypothetical protein
MHRQMEQKKMNRACGPLALAVLLVMLLLAGGVGFAGQIKIGVHAGLSVPNIRDGNDEFSKGFTSRKGPYFGLSADFALASHFSLRAEVNYASQGGKRNGMQPIVTDLPGLMFPQDLILYADFHNETILDYIEIPLLAELSWGNKPRFFVNAGPYVGFLLRAKIVTSGRSTIYLDSSGTQPLLIPPDYQPLPPVSFDATTDVKESINDLNAGIAGGAGLGIRLGPGDLIAAFHYSLGFRNIQKDVATGGKNNTGALIVTLGYSLPLKGSK